MSDEIERFHCVADPVGQWLVWDGNRDEPKVVSGVPLIGLAHREAVAMCRLLNLADDVPRALRRTR